jgi:hypothetical protein
MIGFVAIAVGLFAAYWIYLSLRPLFEKGSFSAEDWAHLEDESTMLLARRDRLIAELRDIEFEAALNKVDLQDLEALRQRYENEAVSVMGILETDVDHFGDRIESDIAEVSTRRATNVKSDPGASTPEVNS